MHSDIHDIVFDINDSNRMYCATDGGVYRVGMVQNTMEMVKHSCFSILSRKYRRKNHLMFMEVYKITVPGTALQKSGRNRI
jgi:hypothetical protein